MLETILVVDDDRDFLESTEALLDAAGFRVITASSSEAAIDAVTQEVPDLMVIDLIMERADSGFSLAHRMRKKPNLAGVPIIMVSGVTQELGFRYSLDSPHERSWIPADMFLDKPLRPEDLVGSIRLTLEKAQETTAR